MLAGWSGQAAASMRPDCFRDNAKEAWVEAQLMPASVWTARWAEVIPLDWGVSAYVIMVVNLLRHRHVPL